MRIAYLGSFANSWDTESYISRALQALGHRVREIEEETTSAMEFADQAISFDSDLVLFAKGRLLKQWEPACEMLKFSLKIIRDELPGCSVASWVFDLMSKEFNPERWKWVTACAPLVDRLFMTDGFTAAKIANGYTLRQGIPDDVRPGVVRDDWKADVLYLGTPYRDRYPEWSRLSRHFGTRLLTIREGVRGTELADLFASVKVVVGPHWPTAPAYWSNRCYVVAGHGGCFVAPEIAGMSDEGWLSGVNFLSCSPDNQIEMIEAVLSSTGPKGAPLYQYIGTNAKALGQSLTYVERCREMLRVIASDRLADLSGLPRTQ